MLQYGKGANFTNAVYRLFAACHFDHSATQSTWLDCVPVTGVGAGEGEGGTLPTAALLLPIGTLETGGGAGETRGG